MNQVIHDIAIENKFSVLTVEPYLRHRVSLEPDEVSSRLHFANERMGVHNLVVILNKYSPYLHRINSVYGRILQSGLHRKWYRDTVPNKGSTILHETNVAVNLKQTQSSFYIVL